MATLRLISGEGGAPARELGDEATIGRTPDNALQIHDTKASRRHTRVVRTGGAWFAEDLGSRNGTLVNDQKISRVRLASGDVITIGTTRIEFLDPDVAANASGATMTAERAVAPSTQPAPGPKAAAAPKAAAPVITPRVVERKFDPATLNRPRAEAASLFGEDLAQRPLSVQLAVVGGGFVAMLVVAGLAYGLTLLALG